MTNYPSRILQVFSICLVLGTVLPDYSFSSAQKEIDALAFELAESYQNKSESTETKKIAILHFDNLSPEAQQSQVGRAVSEMLIRSFSKSGLFRIIEREKLDFIFKELALNYTGAIDPKDAKRVGFISGADFLISGSVADSDGKFLVQARIINVETGEVLVAENVLVDKTLLAREAKEIRYRKPVVGLSVLGGIVNLSKVNLKSGGIGAELYYILSPGRIVSFEILQTMPGNTKLFQDNQVQVTNPFNFSFPLGVKETISSVLFLSAQYKFIGTSSSKTRPFLALGPGLYMLSSEQDFFYAPIPGALVNGLRLPAKTSKSYVVPAFSATLGFQRFITSSARYGFFYTLNYFSFRRDLDPGNGNQTLIPQIDRLNTRVNVFGSIIGGRITVNF